MAGYVWFGPADQTAQRSVQTTITRTRLITPGDCNNGRMLACMTTSQPSAGIASGMRWRPMARSDFVFSATQMARIVAAQMQARGYRFDVWDTFIARKTLHWSCVSRESPPKNFPDGLSLVER